MPKLKKIKEISSKIKEIKEESKEEFGHEDLEEEIEESESEEFKEFLTGTTSADIAPVLETGQMPERIEDMEEVQTVPEETATQIYEEGGRRTAYDVAAGISTEDERTRYEAPVSLGLPEENTQNPTDPALARDRSPLIQPSQQDGEPMTGAAIGSERGERGQDYTVREEREELRTKRRRRE